MMFFTLYHLFQVNKQGNSSEQRAIVRKGLIDKEVLLNLVTISKYYPTTDVTCFTWRPAHSQHSVNCYCWHDYYFYIHTHFFGKSSFINFVPFQCFFYCVFSKYHFALLVYSNCFFKCALFLGKVQWPDFTPRNHWRCLGLVSLLICYQNSFRRLNSNCIKQKWILMVNITKKPSGRSSGTVWSKGSVNLRRTWSFSLYHHIFCPLFCLHSQAAPLCMVAESPHLHPHNSKSSGKELSLSPAKVSGFIPLG